MRRKALIVLLALGTVGGYAAGFASLRWHRWQRQAAFERHVASVCVDAARESDAASRGADRPQQAASPVVVNINPAQPAQAAPAAAPAESPK